MTKTGLITPIGGGIIDGAGVVITPGGGVGIKGMIETDPGFLDKFTAWPEI